MTHFLTDAQYRTLTALCDAIIPSIDWADDEHGFWKRTASDLDVPRLFARAVRDLQTEEQQNELKQLLDALGQPFLAGPLTGYFKPFVALTPAEREKVLQRWAVSPLPQLRKACQGIKRLTAALFYSVTDESNTNPNWPAIGYPGVPSTPRPEKPTRFPILAPDSDILECDVVIVGSGAGGSVVAAELARSGKDVIIVEKGGYYSEEDFEQVEYTAYQKLYENQAILATRDGGVVVLAGAALGGTTVINWSASFRTPDHVRDEWAYSHACPDVLSADYTRALDVVCARLNVSEDEAWASAEARKLELACDRLGLGCGVVPQNRAGCGDPAHCGWCTFGCARGSKQSVLKNYLPDAVEHGARILVRAEAKKVLIENGRAVGVEVEVATEAAPHRGEREAQAPLAPGARPLTIRARATVIAAGSLHSPAVLLRSGIPNPNIGANLRLHPTVPVFGEYAELIEPWTGPMLTRYVNQWANLDGRHYGVVIEHPPAHAGIIGLGQVWLSGEQHKDIVTRTRNQAVFIAITRDREGGRVTVNKRGQPVMDYTVSRHDGTHLLRGVQECFRLHAAAGALTIGGPHSGLVPFRNDGADLEPYLQRVQRLGHRPNALMLFSAHQMGTCRMGGHRTKSVLTPQGESWDVRNLFVADASAFPTATGVNPMITVMALAHQTAHAVKARV
ncbi:MAG: GMC family oxidoreductase N-terminal domain-containing protein [Anaerolineales bacterium]